MEFSNPAHQAINSHSLAQPAGAQGIPPPMDQSVASLLAALEEISRMHPARVLRLRGSLAVDAEGLPVEAAPGAGGLREPYELLIFRGFSSSVTHPTAFDPDRPALPQGATIETAELLLGPLDPRQEHGLAGPHPPETFLSTAAW